jgi:hypothetical protein
MTRVLVFGEGDFASMVWRALHTIEGLYVAPVLLRRLGARGMERGVLDTLRPDLVVVAGVDIDPKHLSGCEVIYQPRPESRDVSVAVRSVVRRARPYAERRAS